MARRQVLTSRVIGTPRALASQYKDGIRSASTLGEYMRGAPPRYRAFRSRPSNPWASRQSVGRSPRGHGRWTVP